MNNIVVLNKSELTLNLNTDIHIIKQRNNNTYFGKILKTNYTIIRNQLSPKNHKSIGLHFLK